MKNQNSQMEMEKEKSDTRVISIDVLKGISIIKKRKKMSEKQVRNTVITTEKKQVEN
ncbi:MAG: hypothetical protein ACTSWY_05170 [Promethearchaeota archaeon]